MAVSGKGRYRPYEACWMAATTSAGPFDHVGAKVSVVKARRGVARRRNKMGNVFFVSALLLTSRTGSMLGCSTLRRPGL